MPFFRKWHSFSSIRGMNAFMIIFFIVLAVTIVMYAAMVKKQAERDEFMNSAQGDDKSRETHPHSPLR
jgi:flagellar biosynthesis/type III secretory pathway M-ring protein FliF/YscJ